MTSLSRAVSWSIFSTACVAVGSRLPDGFRPARLSNVIILHVDFPGDRVVGLAGQQGDGVGFLIDAGKGFFFVAAKAACFVIFDDLYCLSHQDFRCLH